MNRFLKILALGVLLMLPWAGGASAQQTNNYWCNSATLPCPPGAWVPTSPSNPFPTYVLPDGAGQTPITGNGTGTTGAVVGTLTAVVAKTTYICGFSVSAIGGTAAIGPITIAGTIIASLVYYLAASASGNALTQTFTPCIPASAVNTNITITTTADGTASNVAVNSWGYNQ